jgi:hypothetical protein
MLISSFFYYRRQNAEERSSVRSCDDDGSYYPGRLAHRLTSRPTRQVEDICEDDGSYYPGWLAYRLTGSPAGQISQFAYSFTRALLKWGRLVGWSIKYKADLNVLEKGFSGQSTFSSSISSQGRKVNRLVVSTRNTWNGNVVCFHWMLSIEKSC